MIDPDLVQAALATVIVVVMVLYGLTLWFKPPTTLAFTIIWLLTTGSAMSVHGFSVPSMTNEIAPHLAEVLVICVVSALVSLAVAASGSLVLVFVTFLVAVARALYLAEHEVVMMTVIYLGAFIPAMFAHDIYERSERASYDFATEVEKVRAMIAAEETKERRRR